MGGPKVDKSAPHPPFTFFMELAHPWVPLSLQTTQQQHKQPRKTKDKRKNSRRSYLHGPSFFHKHKAQMTTDRGPWTCLGSRMLAPLGSVVVGSFLSLGCLLVPGDEWVNLSLNIWDLHQKSRVLHGPERDGWASRNMWHLHSCA